jgi:hypothetical protein
MRLDLKRTVLVVIDPQIDFMSPKGKSWSILKSYTTGEGISRMFCSNCGSHIFVAQSNQMRLRLGSLDTAPGIAPQMHIFTGSKAAWFSICDDLPQYAERPGGAPAKTVAPEADPSACGQ